MCVTGHQVNTFEGHIMYRILLPLFLFLAACTQGGVTLFNPFTGEPVTRVDPQGYSERRAQVEIAVKSRFEAVLTDIAAGGGPALTAAMDAAAVPLGERADRVIQMQTNLGTYRRNPDALISSLLLYGA